MNIDKHRQYWEEKDRYLLLSVPIQKNHPEIVEWAIIYDRESQCGVLIEDGDLCVEIIRRMRAAGIQEVAEVPEE